MQEALQTHATGLKYRERNAGPQIDEHMSDEGIHSAPTPLTLTHISKGIHTLIPQPGPPSVLTLHTTGIKYSERNAGPQIEKQNE